MLPVFDRFYADYDSWYETPMGEFADHVETRAACELLGPSTGMHFLDAGCGTGNFSFKMAQMGCRVTGIDVSAKMLEQAGDKLATQSELPVTFMQMNCCDLSFPDDHFDGALAMASFEFIADAKAAYREIRRVVRPGGAIVIGTIQRGGPWHLLYGSEVFKDSAYAKATFRNVTDLKMLDPDNFVRAIECLYVPPDLDEEAYNLRNEELYKKQGAKGGFVCAKFVKPL